MHGFGSNANVQSLVFDYVWPSADQAFRGLGNESTSWYAALFGRPELPSH